ncbi:hypothetical protein [Bacillus pinisoli]|uniref:hypothetical protein n=1 Tax=Bacillus pinisoli TaxID=2901866 RepID=UPI001FF34B66|nr:hypothetical protein [Bacillus pinisoli]
MSHDEQPIIDPIYRDLKEMIGEQILVITQTSQLNLLGQTFRPIFCGEISEVEAGHITLFPVIIKFVNAPFYENPFPISIPLEKISQFTTNFDCDTRFSIS